MSRGSHLRGTRGPGSGTWGEASNPQPPAPNPQPPGFTLIEIMIAMIITGIILVGVYGTLVQTLESKEVGEERGELYAIGRDTVLRMAEDIEAALHPQHGVPLATGQEMPLLFQGETLGGRSPRGTVSLVRDNRDAYGVQRVQVGKVYVSYELEDLPRQNGIYRLWRTQRLFACAVAEAVDIPNPQCEEMDEWERLAQVPMLDCPDPDSALAVPGSCIRVRGLEFLFYDDLLGDFRNQWDTIDREGPTGDRLPAAVQIALFLEDEFGVVHDFRTIVDVPMARNQPTPRADGTIGEDEIPEEGDDDLDGGRQ